MSLIDSIFPKQCFLCNRVGYDVCDECIKSMVHTLPSCCICKRLNNKYLTHKGCYEKNIHCFTGWYITKDIEYILNRKRNLGIYSVHICLLKRLIEYLDLHRIVENSTIKPILTENKRENRLNNVLVESIRRSNRGGKDILFIGESSKDVEKIIGLFKEPYDFNFLCLFEDINLPPLQE